MEWSVRRPGPFVYMFWLVTCAVRVAIALPLAVPVTLWRPRPRPTADGTVGLLHVVSGEGLFGSNLRGRPSGIEVRTGSVVRRWAFTEHCTPIDLRGPVSVRVSPVSPFRRSTLAHTPWRVFLTFSSGATGEVRGRWWVICHAARMLDWPTPQKSDD